MRTTILSTTLFAATVLASPRPIHDIVEVRQIERRQDPSSIDIATLIPSSIDINSLVPSGCQTPTDLPAMPTPPANLISVVESVFATYTDPCNQKAPSFTGTVGALYTSWESAVSSWAKTNGPKWSSWYSTYQTACPYIATLTHATGTAATNMINNPQVTDISQALSMFCSTSKTAAGAGAGSSKATGTAAGSATGTGTQAGTATGAGQSSGTAAASKGAAPQQTGFAAAAGLLAGFAGVVAAL